MNPRNRRLLGMGLAVASISVAFLVFRAGSSAPSAAAAPAALEARDVDKATRLATALARLKQGRASRLQAVEAASDAEREPDFLRALREPADVKRALLEDRDGKWSPTVLRLEDLAFAKEGRRECGQVLGGEIQEMCNYRVDMAIERSGPREGIIRRVKSSLTEKDGEPVCEAFADCVAFARLGLPVPLPEEDRRVYGIGQALQTTPLAKDMRDPAFVDRQIASARVGIDAFRSQVDPDDPVAMHNLRSMMNLLAYLESWSAELKARR